MPQLDSPTWRVWAGLLVFLISGSGCAGPTLTAQRTSSVLRGVTSLRIPARPLDESSPAPSRRLTGTAPDADLFAAAIADSTRPLTRPAKSLRRASNQHASLFNGLDTSSAIPELSLSEGLSDHSWLSAYTPVSWGMHHRGLVPWMWSPRLLPSPLSGSPILRAQNLDSISGQELDPWSSGRRSVRQQKAIVGPREPAPRFSMPGGSSDIDPFASPVSSTDETGWSDPAPFTPGCDDPLIDVVAEPRKGIFHDLFAPEPLDDLGPLLGSPIGHRWRRIVRDYRYMYGNSDMWVDYGFALGIAAILANTDLDRNIQDFHQDQIRNNFTNRISDPFTTLGDGNVMLPIYLGTLFITNTFPNLPVSPEAHEWSARTLRAMLVGSPLLVVTQKVLGPARPDAGWDYSRWDLFGGGVVGASGHAFMSAIPFLAAAEMTNDPVVKASMIALSAMGGFARFNDDRHYASQVFLGWWIAYLSTRTTSITQGQPSYRLAPVPLYGGDMGLGVERRF